MVLMTRLDQFLVNRASVSSRSKAKRAILAGNIAVNGLIVKKASYKVRPNDLVELCAPLDQINKASGYFKLNELNNHFQFLEENHIVLDLGSSAGGWLEYCCERCKNVVGIEISRDFKSDLQNLMRYHSNLKIYFEDVFKISLELLSDLRFDVILNDLTLSPEISLTALKRFLPYLKDQGMMLMSLKYGKIPIEDCKEFTIKELKAYDLKPFPIQIIDEESLEFHILAQNVGLIKS